MKKSNGEVYATPNRVNPARPILFDEQHCTGCNSCLEACMADVLIPHPVKGKPPIVLFPDECFYCGCCVEACPTPGACTFNHPLTQRVRWKRKTTGESFRVKPVFPTEE